MTEFPACMKCAHAVWPSFSPGECSNPRVSQASTFKARAVGGDCGPNGTYFLKEEDLDETLAGQSAAVAAGTAAAGKAAT